MILIVKETKIPLNERPFKGIVLINVVKMLIDKRIVRQIHK